MTVRETGFDGLVLFEPVVHADERGFFLETFRDEHLAAAGLDRVRFVQDNHSRSVRGTSWTAALGSPAFCSPSATASPMARLEWNASEPPRKMTALPERTHSAAASAVTLGRDS